MAIDHDQVFKRLIEAFFREFMDLFCPGEAQLIEFSEVEFLGEEYFTDVERGCRRLLDLVVKVGLKAGGEKFVLVHAEFEASRKERDFPRRMFKYFCQLFLRYDTEIVPIAVFTDDATWKTPVPDHFELSLPGKTFVRFDYHLIKLKNLDYRQFLESKNPLAFGLMAKMGYNRQERVRLKADFLRLILASPIDPARESLLVEFVETYLPLAGDEQTEFLQIVGNDQQYAKVEQMITTYETKGRQEGKQEGKQEDLILLLEKKFGKLGAAVKRKVRAIESTERLESLLLAVLDANSLKDLPL
jgi:CRISPR/Cas system CSM-associated protein Csm2 small subunit